MAIGDITTKVGGALGSAANCAGNKIVNKAAGRLEGMARNAIDSVLFRVPGQIVSLFSASEDFNRLRQVSRQLVRTDFQTEWNFRLDLEGAPADFDFYVKDVSYSHFDIATDEEQCGSASYVWPTADQPLRISFTMRDNIDGRNAVFLSQWWGQVVGPDGTVGLPFGPNGYVRKAMISNIDVTGRETLSHAVNCYPIQVGDISRSRENWQFLEIPVTLAQFSTII